MIRVTEKNAEKVTAAIDKAQNLARVRTICRADVFDAVEEVERKLSQRLYKKDWIGLLVEVDTQAQSFPSAYKGTPESTRFQLVHRPSGWFIHSIQRGVCGTTEYACRFFNKSEELRRFATDKF